MYRLVPSPMEVVGVRVVLTYLDWQKVGLKPTTKELEARTTQNWNLLKRGSKKSAIKRSAREYVAETSRQQAQMDRLIANWTKGGHGHIDLKKTEGVIQLIQENFNSLCILTDERILTKIRNLDALRKRYKID